MSLHTTYDLIIEATLAKARDLNNTATSPMRIRERVTLLTGTGAGKADKLFYDQRTLAASTSEDLDLVGALTDDFGDSFNPVRIKLLYVKAAVGNANNVVVGAAAATQWAAFLGTTGTMTLRPGSRVSLAAGEADATGYVCAAGATDLLKIANSGAGTSVTYDIIAIGVSA